MMEERETLKTAAARERRSGRIRDVAGRCQMKGINSSRDSKRVSEYTHNVWRAAGPNCR